MSNTQHEIPDELPGVNPTAANHELEDVTDVRIKPEDAAIGAAAARERAASLRRGGAAPPVVRKVGYPAAELVEEQPASLLRRTGRTMWKVGKVVGTVALTPVIWPLKTIYNHAVENKLMTAGVVALGGGLAVAGAYGANAAFGQVIDYQDILASTALTPISFPLASKLFREGFAWASHNVNYFKNKTYTQLQANFAGRIAGLAVASVLAFAGGVYGKDQAMLAYEGYTAIPRVAMREIPSTAMHLFTPHLSNTRWDPGWNLTRHARCLQYKALDPSGAECLAGPGSDAIQMTVDMSRLRSTFGEQAVPQNGVVQASPRQEPAEFFTPRGFSSALFGPRYGGLPAGQNLVLQ